jgi:hypothetical protein
MFEDMSWTKRTMKSWSISHEKQEQNFLQALWIWTRELFLLELEEEVCEELELFSTGAAASFGTSSRADEGGWDLEDAGSGGGIGVKQEFLQELGLEKNPLRFLERV